MKIVFEHKFGAQEKNHLEHYSATLIDVQDEDIDVALETGWLTDLQGPAEKDVKWYQCRSTRCDLSKFTSKDPLIKEGNDDGHDNILHYKFNANVSQDTLENIYHNYCDHHGYKDFFHDEVSNWIKSDYKMVYYYNHKPVAWSKLRMYSEDALETVLFCWNYNDKEEKIGYKSLLHELSWAKEKGFKYVYVGPGYEKGSIYKAHVQGFEWWTGKEWSTNKNEYIKLCERDSELKTIEELSQL